MVYCPGCWEDAFSGAFSRHLLCLYEALVRCQSLCCVSKEFVQHFPAQGLAQEQLWDLGSGSSTTCCTEMNLVIESQNVWAISRRR